MQNWSWTTLEAEPSKTQHGSLMQKIGYCTRNHTAILNSLSLWQQKRKKFRSCEGKIEGKIIQFIHILKAPENSYWSGQSTIQWWMKRKKRRGEGGRKWKLRRRRWSKREGRGREEKVGPTSVQRLYPLKCKKLNSRIHQRTKNTHHKNIAIEQMKTTH